MFKNKYKTLSISIFTAFIAVFSFVNKSFTQSESRTSIERIINKVEELNKSSQLKNAAWGFCIKKCESNETLFEYNSNMGLIPASSLKIVTTAAAISLLGPDFQYETKLQYSGEIDSSGTLLGNLYIKGGGDPTFCFDFDKTTTKEEIFNKFLNAIKNIGINRIKGSVIGDESIFNWNRIPGSWTYEDVGNYYGSGTCGLSYNNNQYKIFFNSGKTINEPAVFLKSEPEIQGLKLINKVTTAGKYTGDKVIVLCCPWSDTCWLTGTVPQDSKSFLVKGAMPDPALSCAKDFSLFLNENGISVDKNPLTSRVIDNINIIDTAQRKDIFTLFSPPLYKIINYINDKSDNTFAESVNNMCGLKNNLSTDTRIGAVAITSFWSSKDIDLKGFNMVDGSGLSRKNYITTNQLSTMLAFFSKEPTYKYLYNSLGVAGISSSIKNMFKGSYAENNLRGKTGTMEGIRSLAGYVNNKKGELLAYSIIINNYSGQPKDVRKMIEELLIIVSEIE